MNKSQLVYDDKDKKIPFERNSWVSATKTRNYIANDGLLDWLNIYGIKKGFRKDTKKKGYDINLDFTNFLFEQGTKFEETVIEYLKIKHGDTNFVEVSKIPSHSRSLEKAEETLELMNKGIPFIIQGVLWNPNNRTFGIPDILVRSDWLNEITVEPLIKALKDKDWNVNALKDKDWNVRNSAADALKKLGHEVE